MRRRSQCPVPRSDRLGERLSERAGTTFLRGEGGWERLLGEQPADPVAVFYMHSAMSMSRPTLTADQFLRPLDFIEAEHDRQRVFCDRLVELANERNLEAVIEEAETILAFITEDLPLHHKDEETDLFRMLRCRRQPDDDIDAILATLAWEHTMDSFLTYDLRLDLKTLVSGKKIVDDNTVVFTDLRTFAESQRRHLDWEEKLVVPLAHKRLMPEDLSEMGRNMAARRGIAYPAY